MIKEKIQFIDKYILYYEDKKKINFLKMKSNYFKINYLTKKKSKIFFYKSENKYLFKILLEINFEEFIKQYSIGTKLFNNIIKLFLKYLDQLKENNNKFIIENIINLNQSQCD